MEDAGEAVSNKIGVEYLILADGAQVQGGKLYVLGGGWDRIQAPQFPYGLSVGIALGLRVPWGQTNRRHQFRIAAKSADADEVLFQAQGEFEMGRPPGIPSGMSQLFQAAITLPVEVKHPGQYVLEIQVDADATHLLPFYAVELPGVQVMPPPG